LGQREARKRPKIRHRTPPERKQRPTEALIPRVLNPGPSSFWAGDRNAARKPQQKAADVTRARGAAAA